MEQTISYRFGRDRSVSAEECREVSDPVDAVDSEDSFGSAEEWTDAIAIWIPKHRCPKY
jgi:hypothetical protein